jgi:proteasome lid subunit RPN8/RPN11
METGTDIAWGEWTTPECPVRIEYSARVLDDIRLAVVDAFFSLPRGGAEIGGVLLGKYQNGRLTITDSLPLDCEHAFGPSFTLSPKDFDKLAHMLATASRGAAKPMGWYHSHTRSELFFSEADQEIHNRFFPEPWQVALVLKPHTFHPTRAGFFFRGDGGAIRGTACYKEFPLEPLSVRQVPASRPPAPSFGEALTADEAANGPVINVEPEQAIGTPEPFEPPAPEAPTPIPEREEVRQVQPVSREVAPPAFLEQEPAPRRWMALVAVVLGLGLGVGVFQTRQHWMPMLKRAEPGAPPAPVSMGLSLVDQEGQLQIRWDPRNPEMRDATRVILTIQDGALPQALELDSTQLQAGSLSYARQTERVDVTLMVERLGRANAHEVRTFFGKLPERVPPAVQESHRQELESERLKIELKNQAARTRKLEQSLEDVKQQLQMRKRMENQIPPNK